jgi:hypothetical protein
MAAKPSLLDLPDPCLLAIISHCRSDARTLCNAALAHSSLHSAAAPAHTSISLRIMPGHMPSLLRFLTAHGQHVQHLHLSRDGSAVDLPALQLPPSVQLESLALSNLHVSLSLDSSDQHSLGVLDRQSRLQTLSWYNCSTDTSLDGIAAALKQLPALRDLAVTGVLVQATHHCAPEDTLLAFPGM